MNAAPRLRPRIARLVSSAILLVLALASAAGLSRAADGPWVRVLTATGVVDGALAGYLREGVEGAAEAGAAAVVVRLDTPGGSASAMDEIKQAFLGAGVPVIAWVGPSGARAASAGTFIALSANLVFMAPATNIGAASPVASNGADIPGTLGVKVREDAVASIRALAQARGRPVDWAVSTVADARSYSADEALAAGAIDAIEPSLAAVLAAADGRVVQVPGRGAVTLALAGAALEDAPMSPLLAVLHVLADPNIAFLLFVLGALGLAVELVHPNLLSGLTGGVALLLAFVGFGSLPLNVAGLVLIALGFGLFVLETQVASHGLLALGGAACVALGGSALYTAPLTPTAPIVAVAPLVLGTTTLVLAAAMALVTLVALRTRRMPGPADQLGAPVPAGTHGIVQAPLAPLGTVHLAGETWTARTPDERPVPRETPVRLVGFDGLTALVEPLAGEDVPASPSATRRRNPGGPTIARDPSAAHAADPR